MQINHMRGIAPATSVSRSVISFSAEITIATVEVLIAAVMDELGRGATTIDLLISSPGGQVVAGMNAYNVLKGLPVALTTHNVGNVDSIGNIIFLAGKTRRACASSTFMFHGVSTNVAQAGNLDTRRLKEMGGTIDADHARIAAVISKETKLSAEEVKALFIEMQTKDAQFCVDNGFVHEIAEVVIPKGSNVVPLVFNRAA